MQIHVDIKKMKPIHYLKNKKALFSSRAPQSPYSLYLCHRVSLSTLVDTDTLQRHGDMKPHAHNDTFPHSRHQTGLVHMLSTEGANWRL